MAYFVRHLCARLPKDRQMFVVMLADRAINEFMNSGAIRMLPPELQAKAHDPDPEVRVNEKISMAKALGNQFITNSRPGKGPNGLMHIISVDYDPKLLNCILLSIQGGLEGLYISEVWKKNPSRTMEYHVLIGENGQDPAPLEQNLELLGMLYPEMKIIPVRMSGLRKPPENG